jgi:hypothetical protein
MIKADTTKRSSTFARVAYDPAAMSLHLEFKSGHRYKFANVDPLTHAKFMASKSLGKAFNLMFWGQPKLHPSSKLPSNLNPSPQGVSPPQDPSGEQP